jgi:hypothetical protein
VATPLYVGEKRGKKKRELHAVTAVFDVTDSVTVPFVAGTAVSDEERNLPRIVSSWRESFSAGAKH